LLAAGRLTLELIREARTQAPASKDSDDDNATAALRYFDMWSRAVRNAGPVDTAQFRPLLEDVQREAAGAAGDLAILAYQAKELEHVLSPSTVHTVTQ
jgi:hypothetical protein